jgi:hypothetical protein
VLDDEEAVEQLERHRRHGEEVEGHDDFPVVLEKCQPPLTWIAPPPHSPQIASDRPFGDVEGELQQFAMDLGRSPIGILLGQAPDQPTNLSGDLRSAAARPRATNARRAGNQRGAIGRQFLVGQSRGHWTSGAKSGVGWSKKSGRQNSFKGGRGR